MPSALIILATTVSGLTYNVAVIPDFILKVLFGVG